MDINITELLDSAVEDALDDEEVHFYMTEKIMKDVCLCKKYGKPSKRKPCPVCNENYSLTEPKTKQQRKKSRIPQGNFGRTGCLKKPDLCSIPEDDILTEFTSELKPHPYVTTKTKKMDKCFINEEFNQQTTHNVAEHDCRGNNCLENNNIVTPTKFTKYNKGITMPNACDEDRIKSNGTAKGYVKLNANSVHINCLTTNSKKNKSNDCTEQEQIDIPESQISGDAKRCYSAERENSFRWKKPKLIPVRDFLKRYFPLPPINSKLRKMELPDTLGNGSKTEQVFSNTRKEGNKPLITSNAICDDANNNLTDDQKMIKALSRITIHPSDIEKNKSK